MLSGWKFPVIAYDNPDIDENANKMVRNAAIMIGVLFIFMSPRAHISNMGLRLV